VEAGRNEGKSHFVFKTPCLTEQFDNPDKIASDPLAAHVFPFPFEYKGESLLFLVRDPRDVYLSLRKMKQRSSGAEWIDSWPKYLNEFYPERVPGFQSRYTHEIEILRESGALLFAAQAALYWKIKTESYFRYCELGCKILLLLYEDLLTNPRGCLEAIAGFLNIPFDERLLRHHELRHSGLYPDGLAGGRTDPHRPIDSSSTRLYSTELSLDEDRVIMAIAGDTYCAIQREWLRHRSGEHRI
jgi:hypothetical protein